MLDVGGTSYLMFQSSLFIRSNLVPKQGLICLINTSDPTTHHTSYREFYQLLYKSKVLYTENISIFNTWQPLALQDRRSVECNQLVSWIISASRMLWKPWLLVYVFIKGLSWKRFWSVLMCPVRIQLSGGVELSLNKLGLKPEAAGTVRSTEMRDRIDGCVDLSGIVSPRSPGPRYF